MADSSEDRIFAAWAALVSAHLRAGIVIKKSELERVARRFALNGIEVAQLEERAEAEKILERPEERLPSLIEPVKEERQDSESLKSLDLYMLFKRDLGKIHLLSFDEEIKLSERVAMGDRARSSLLADELEEPIRARLEKTAKDGDQAYDEFLRNNAPLVMKVIPHYLLMGLDHLDILQAGLIGLMSAVERWNPSLGFRFSTYATYWIQSKITREIANTGRMIRLPVHVIESLTTIRKARSRLRSTQGTEPSIQDIADACGIDTRKVATYLDVYEAPQSLDGPVGIDSEAKIADVLCSKEAFFDPAMSAIAKDEKRILIAALERLTDRERTVLYSRFGLLDDKQQTLEQIGDRFGVTRERIRQIEGKALRKLERFLGSSLTGGSK